MSRPFRFAMFAYAAGSRQEWEEKARRAEALGYATLVTPDHFLNPLTPVPALAVAAAVTTTLRIGSIVFANDFRHPPLLAKEAATLDLLSDGRFEFGLGAGWYQKEYDLAGIPFAPAGTRLERMAEALAIIRALWGEGTVTFQGRHYTVNGLEGTPQPVQHPHPPIFIGGTGPRLLRLAGREADIVGFNPKPLPEGGHDWLGSTAELRDQQVAWVREGAGDRFAAIELAMVAYRAIVTEQPQQVAAELAPKFGLTAAQLRERPDVLIGSVTEIVDMLYERRERFGISYIEVSDAEATAFAPVVARLAGK
ncbi:MAG: TIGR03621 family F420-dependent LLM class oxidoreductase [Thermomicrobiales bacterium]